MTDSGVTAELFAAPGIVVGEAGEGDGSFVLRLADPLGDYPVSVVHSLREWTRATHWSRNVRLTARGAPAATARR
jgi:hypothetical protein